MVFRPGWGLSSQQLNDMYERIQYDSAKLLGYSASGVITASGFPSGTITISGLYDILDDKLESQTKYMWEVEDWLTTRINYADQQLIWNAEASGQIPTAGASGAPDPW